MNIEYKKALLPYWFLLIFMLSTMILFLVVFNSGDAIYQTVDRTKLISLLCMLVSAVVIIYSLFVISVNLGKTRSVEFDDEKIVFYRYPHSQKKTTVYLEQIKDSRVRRIYKSGVKVLIIKSDKRVYRIPEMGFSEREFSCICNAVVKSSLLCKACQSTQVSWSGEQGHCHNCETITPMYSDKFDWKNAYQAD